MNTSLGQKTIHGIVNNLLICKDSLPKSNFFVKKKINYLLKQFINNQFMLNLDNLGDLE